jgi:L-alanine-DL-glutamate epimerase-like enolase superfamily enzyme
VGHPRQALPGQPVYKLLGGPNRDKIPAYYTGFDVDKALELGFRSFKHPIRHNLEAGREGMKKVIAELRGSEPRSARASANDGRLLPVERAPPLEMADRMQEFRLYWIEEPLSPDDLEGYAQLCREIRGPLIASGEHEYTRFGSRTDPSQPWRAAAAGHHLYPRPVGGPQSPALAAAHNLPMAPHRGGSPYGISVILTTPSCVLAESFGTLEKSTPLMAALTSRFENGYYYPTDKPGFGVDITPSML